MSILGSTTRRALVPDLLKEIRYQAGELPQCEARLRHLAQLAEPDLGVVVTGQQVGLFLGPVLGFYKAATAIVLARRLAAAGQPTAPVFWLQSEDHDADEVQAVQVLGQQDDLKSVILTPTGSPRVPMAERELGEGVTEALENLATEIGEAPFRDEALGLLCAHYRPQTGWTEAFSGALSEVFAEEGLLTFNPRSEAVARLVRPIHRFALENASAIDHALLEGAETLEAEGERPGVKPRPGCSLNFFHPQGPGGPRYRLVQTPQGWQLPGNDDDLATSSLLTQLDEHPLHFSTSALLRVVTQQMLFPVMTQVVGPGEGRYLRQTPPLLEAFGCSALAVTPRLRLAVKSPRCDRRLTRLGLDIAEFDSPVEVLRRLANDDDGVHGDSAARSLQCAFTEELDRISGDILAIDPQLERELTRTRRHMEKGTTALGARIDRARVARDQQRIAHVERLGHVLTPGGQPQERVLGVVHFIARFGLARFKTAVFRAVEQHLDQLQLGKPPQLLGVSL